MPLKFQLRYQYMRYRNSRPAILNATMPINAIGLRLADFLGPAARLQARDHLPLRCQLSLLQIDIAIERQFI